MKKFLCAALTVMMLVMTALAVVPASAEEAAENSDVLVITANGENPVEVKVGDEFIYRVGLYAGEQKILDGQVEMYYDSDYVSFVPHKAYSSITESEEVENYSFPSSIVNSGIVFNAGGENTIRYNFSRAMGVAVFNDPSRLFARFRFKATAPGQTDISHIIRYMINVDDQRVYYKNEPSDVINPYMAITIEPSKGCVGDADGDYEVTILDATFMQRVAGGATLDYDVAIADVTGDNFLSLKDAMIVRQYLAGKSVDSNVGTWLYDSE